MRPSPVWISSATKSVAIFPAELLNRRQVVVVGDVDALALDRLDDKGRDLPSGQRLFERGEIVEGYFHAIRQEWSESLAKDLIADERQGTVAETMEGMAAIDDPRPAGGRTREFDRRFDCLGAGIGEEDLVEMRREPQQPLGQQAGKD